MHDLVNHPVVLSGVAPFLAALLAMAVLPYLRLGGLAPATAFAATALLAGSLNPIPDTDALAGRITLLGFAAPLTGLLVDFAFKPTRLGHGLLAALAALAGTWALGVIPSRAETLQSLLTGGSVAAFMACLTAVAFLHGDRPLRAGATGMGLALGCGVAGLLLASAEAANAAAPLYRHYAMALCAGCAAVLLWQAITNKLVPMGWTLALGATVPAGLLIAATLTAGRPAWYALAAFALVPAATLLPLPERAHVAVQAAVASIYAIAVSAGACTLLWLQNAGKLG